MTSSTTAQVNFSSKNHKTIHLTWLKPTVPVFQFFTSSKGNVGMKDDVVAVDGVNPGANMLAESVIGTVTEKRKKIPNK